MEHEADANPLRPFDFLPGLSTGTTMTHGAAMHPSTPAIIAPYAVPFDGRCVLADLPTAPPESAPSKSELKRQLQDYVDELRELQRMLYADKGQAVLTVFQAMDAAGKDSTIRSVFSGVNPAGFRVHAFGPPSELERGHDFLWRCTQRLPERGRIGIFNRSHYEETLVVRLNPHFLEGQGIYRSDLDALWEERFASIRAWEEHLARNGTVIVKFWLNISRDEQRRRFLRRIERPDKHWKFRLGDLDDRARWPEFMHAYEQVLRHTSRPWAPWYAIPADDKPFMRVQVARVMVETLRAMSLSYPAVNEEQRAELDRGKARLDAEGS